VVFVLLAGCAFSAHDKDGMTGGSGSGAFVDDTAADFQGGSGDAVIDPRGTLEPAAYSRGGLRARAYDGKHVTGTTASWAEIETEVASAQLRGIAYEQLPANWMGGHPSGLALTGDDNFTVIYEGELYVTPGDHVVDIDGDDAGALAIGGQFVVDAGPGPKSITVHADAATWMPIQLAIGEGTGNSQLIARLDGAALTADETRAATTTDQGLLVRIYYQTNTTELVTGAALDMPNVNWGMTPPPYDLPGVPTGYTARFMGQLRIDEDGMYTIAATPGNADDSTELYIDGHLVARDNGFPDPHPTSATLLLTAGWHGIAISLSGSQKNIFGVADAHPVTLATTIAAGDGAPVPVTAETLRPAATSGYLSLSLTAPTYLNDTTMSGGMTTIPVPLTVPPLPVGAVVDNATLGFFYHHATPTDYTVTLDMAGTSKSLPSTNSYLVVYGDETAAGQAVPATAGAWSYTFVDSVPGNAANQADQSAQVLVELDAHGGPLMPFATSWLYVSNARRVDATAWGALTVTANLAGAALTISVRSADSADALASAPWVDVANGGVPAIRPAAYVQYRLAVTGDGWAMPTVDRVELDYTPN